MGEDQFFVDLCKDEDAFVVAGFGGVILSSSHSMDLVRGWFPLRANCGDVALFAT